MLYNTYSRGYETLVKVVGKVLEEEEGALEECLDLWEEDLEVAADTSADARIAS